MQITINEALGVIRMLKERHAELAALRNDNSNRERYFLGAAGDKLVDKTPVYDVRKLDKTVAHIAMEIRKLDTAIKAHNAVAKLEGYDWDENILGVIETTDDTPST